MSRTRQKGAAVVINPYDDKLSVDPESTVRFVFANGDWIDVRLHDKQGITVRSCGFVGPLHVIPAVSNEVQITPGETE